MFDAFLQGFTLVFQWPTIGVIVLGVAIGAWLGAVPGLGGIIGLSIQIPFTFEMDPVPAFALLLAMVSVTATSDTIASVLLGVPGTAASQATILDGHPLAMKGEASRAFGAAFTVSAFGGVFGAFILAVSIPLVLPIILAFNAPEIFMLGVLGLSMVGSLTGGSVLKGLAIGCFGVVLSTVGTGDTVPIPRFNLGTDYLIDSLPFLPVVLGIFAIPELMELALKDTSISRVPKDQAKGGGILRGIKDAWVHRWLAVRCAALGSYIGILPGLGAAIVDWLAYGHAVQSAKDRSKFGQGDIRGVIGPEAANNATQGGALIPAVAFGIPGGVGVAILLSALMIQGLRPGPEMLTKDAHVTFSMVWTIVVANLLVAGVLMFWSRQVARVAFLPGHLIVPGVLFFVFMGSWLGGASLGDWVSVIFFGILGYLMKRSGWSRPPLVLGLILGDIMENKFNIAWRVHDGWGWLDRPIVLIIIALIGLTIYLSARGIISTRRQGAVEQGEGRERNPLVSLMVSVPLLVFFTWAPIESAEWPRSIRHFPATFALPGLAFVLLIVVSELRAVRSAVVEHAGIGAAWREAREKALLKRAVIFFAYLIAMVLAMLVIGQKLALPILMYLYLRRWGEYSRRLSGAYALAGYAVLVVFYEHTLHMFWFQALLPEWVIDVAPKGFPTWLF